MNLLLLPSSSIENRTIVWDIYVGKDCTEMKMENRDRDKDIRKHTNAKLKKK